MKKNLHRLLIMIVLLTVIVVYEHQTMKSINQVETITVYQFNKSLNIGDPLKQEDLNAVEFPINLITNEVSLNLKDTHSSYMTTPVIKGMYLLNDMVSQNNYLRLSDNQRLITIKCSIEESNGWLSQRGDSVDLFMITPETVIPLHEVIVYKAFDDQLLEENDYMYYVMIVTDAQAAVYYKYIQQSDIYVSIKS